MKSTWPMQEPTRGDPMRPIFHMLVLGRLGVALGRLGRLGVVLDRFGVALGPQGFLDTNMLV